MVRTIALLLSAVTLSSCVALVPFIEPDEQARLSAEGTRWGGSYYTPSYALRRGSYGSPEETAQRVDRYTRIVNSGEAVERAHAAYWLGEMGAQAQSAVPVLVSNLSHENHWVRRACAKALGKIGSPTAVDPLRRSLHDPDKFVAHSAANALRLIGTRDALAAVRTYHGI